MDKERLPQWGWLLIGLFGAVLFGNLLNVAVFFPLGLAEAYGVATVIALMAPVLFFVNVWFDDDRADYWDNSRTHMIGDVLFVVVGAAVGAATALVALQDVGLSGFVVDILGMVAGFLLAWGLFWWRNLELYRGDEQPTR